MIRRSSYRLQTFTPTHAKNVDFSLLFRATLVLKVIKTLHKFAGDLERGCGAPTTILFVGVKFKVPLFRIGWLQGSCKLHEVCNHPVEETTNLNVLSPHNIVAHLEECHCGGVTRVWGVSGLLIQVPARKTFQKSMDFCGLKSRFPGGPHDRVPDACGLRNASSLTS